jgi:hypothetical protein
MLQKAPKYPRNRLSRKSFFIDPKALKAAKKALGVATDSEAVRLSLSQIAEMDRFWSFMEKSRGSLPVGTFERD